MLTPQSKILDSNKASKNPPPLARKRPAGPDRDPMDVKKPVFSLSHLFGTLNPPSPDEQAQIISTIKNAVGENEKIDSASVNTATGQISVITKGPEYRANKAAQGLAQQLGSLGIHSSPAPAASGNSTSASTSENDVPMLDALGSPVPSPFS